MKGKRIGFALTGSYCTFAAVVPEILRLREGGAEIVPIMSETAARTDTRFGRAQMWRSQVLAASGAPEIIDTITAAEPIGPGKLLDLVIVAPCTGNTLAKIAGGITDSSVTMAVKAHLRNLRPVLIAISTNDGLGQNAVNLARLQSTKHIFLVPYGQDNPEVKPNSLVAAMELIPKAAEMALAGVQLQPVLVSRT
ncbi:MAG: dipicolinate synthase subunit B [Selenomonadales bacterium]|jgi:dipicolinate synthase subunit B|nr:dipicolinate synthase subunit B [Selenomonadales bacterium]